MILYIIIYVYIMYIGIMSVLFLKNKYKKSAVVLLFIFIGLFLIGALRAPTVGTDLQSYIELFKNIQNTQINLNILDSRYEFGYLIYNKIINLFTNNVQIFIISSLVIMLVSYFLFINIYSNNKFLSGFLFVALGVYSFTLSGLRGAIAGCILLWSYKYLKERNFIKFAIVVIISSTFHIGAFSFIILYFVTYFSINRKFYGTFILISLGLFSCIHITTSVLLNAFTKYKYYLGGDYLGGDIRIAAIKNFLILFVIIMIGIITKYHKSDTEGKIFLQILLVGMAFLLFSLKYTAFNRVSQIFTQFAVIYLPNSLELIKNKYLKIIIIISMIVLFIFDSIITQILRPYWSNIWPYHFFWQ